MGLDSIFFQISILLGIVAIVSLLVHLLRQPFIIGYIITGILAGPVFIKLIDPKADFYHSFAEFGVVLLLFVLGLSLNFNHLKQIGKVAVITGVGQVLFTGLIGSILLIFMGFDLLPAIFLAVAITFSSTIIIVKLLTDKKEIDSVYGQYTVGLMLVQDVIAIIILLLIPLLVQTENNSLTLILAQWFGRAIVMFSLVYLLSKFLLPILLDRIAKSAEFLFTFTIAWCFGIAGLAHWGGFSLEVGALMAGLSLGSTPYHFEIGSRIKPLRDFFIMLFFIILGAQMDLSNLVNVIWPGIILSVFILIGNPFILYVLFRFNNFSRRNSFLAGVTAAQVSEFGFVLLFIGQSVGYVNNDMLATFTIVALLTIFVSSYLITYNKKIFNLLHPFLKMFGKEKHHRGEDENNNILQFDVWVFGYHRLGWKICEALKEQEKSFAVVDFDPQVNQRLKQRGIPSFYGDAGDIEFLDELPITTAKLIIMTLPDPNDQITAIRYLKKINPKVIIIGTLNHTVYLDDLYAAGADYIMMPHLLGGQWMTEVLKKRSWSKRTYERLRQDQKKELKLRFNVVKR